MRAVARVARRPLKQSGNFSNLGIVKELRSLPVDRIRQLIMCADCALDAVHQSIFQTNLNRIFANSSKVAFAKLVLSVPLVGAAQFRALARAEVRSLCKRWQRRGTTAFIRLELRESGRCTALDLFCNANQWGKKSSEHFRCP